MRPAAVIQWISSNDVTKGIEVGGVNGDGNPVGVGTVLVSRAPFTGEDLDRLDAATSAMQFETTLSPRATKDATLRTLASPGDLRSFLGGYPVNLEPPTDDSPFFFQMLRPRDMFRLDLLNAGKSRPNMVAVFVLGALLFTVIALSVLCIVVPLGLVADRSTLGGARNLLAYFAAIGIGFMLVETSQMQRLIIVLGHPTYGLTVVLFALLLSSGLGSYLTASVDADIARAGRTRLLVLLAVLVALPLVFYLHLPSKYLVACAPAAAIIAAARTTPCGRCIATPSVSIWKNPPLCGPRP